MNGMGTHESSSANTTSWLTPPEIVENLGPFDLDPACHNPMPWETADVMLYENGLESDWGNSFVWLNPPYGRETFKWLSKLAEHPGGGIALIFARTETVGFFSEVWNKADALLFIESRLSFRLPDGTKAKGNSGAPSVLVAYGDDAKTRLRESTIKGAYVESWKAP